MFFESITPVSPPIIAEIGLAHDGSLGQALAFIDAAAQSGAEIVKFQMHFGESINIDTPDDLAMAKIIAGGLRYL